MYSEEEIAALDKDARQRLAESDLSEVIRYVELGQALHFAHVLELKLAALATMHEAAQAAQTPHEFERIVQANLAGPLGKKVGILRRLRVLDAAQADDLERAVAQRNRVAHWYTVSGCARWRPRQADGS